LSVVLFSPDELWTGLGWPLTRMMLFISIGLFVAIVVESLNWNRRIGALTRPLIRAGNFSDRTSAAFSMALISGVSANTMLAESYTENKLSKRELILANLLNSLPTYCLHLPTMMAITIPLIPTAAAGYLGITLGAAAFRTLAIVLVGRLTLSGNDADRVHAPSEKPDSARSFMKTVSARFSRRLKKIAMFTVPIYICVYFMNRLEFFSALENIVAAQLSFIPLLSPQAMGIIALGFTAEISASLAAAGALLNDNVLTTQQAIVALLIGNIISSPLRALRHQFPYYAGIFKPRLAMELIIYNQSFRALSLIVATIFYIIFNS
jgi:hypothetical protein